ncbi:hypothetical protein ACFVAD_20395 [Sutcliffiella sp. NPDC057660]|uniref:hypothetical protein n=1 Tax=Sutcliffiella sp. NPDC057660 TaxID=3346199 RepID=UPI003685E24F
MENLSSNNVIAHIKIDGKEVPVYESNIGENFVFDNLLIEVKSYLAATPIRRELIGVGYALLDKPHRFAVTRRNLEEVTATRKLLNHLKTRHNIELDSSTLEDPACIDLDSWEFEYVRFVKPNGREISLVI